jgi:hypothetical protein
MRSQKDKPLSERSEDLNPMNMQKGKTLTLLVLVVEIASIVILHAVKINQTEKTAVKEAVRNSAAEVSGAPQKTTYSVAAFK